MTVYANVWATGLVEVSEKQLDGSLPLASAKDAETMNQWLSKVCRHGYKGEMLVPGIPEADGHKEGLEAFDNFRSWLRARRHDEVTVL